MIRIVIDLLALGVFVLALLTWADYLGANPL